MFIIKRNVIDCVFLIMSFIKKIKCLQFVIDKLKVGGNKENFLKICKLWLTNAFKGYIILLLIVKWHHSQVVRQRSAKPSSPVRIWVVPPFDK